MWANDRPRRSRDEPLRLHDHVGSATRVASTVPVVVESTFIEEFDFKFG